jgi:3',5'-cyclic-AMP phosphodiesterase
VAVSAVEDTAVQVMWGLAPPGVVTVTAAGRRVTSDHPGGPGGVVLDGLAPNAEVEVEVRIGRRRARRRTRTLTRPRGELLSRVVTLSDLHIGHARHGLLKTMADRTGLRPAASIRCGRAALAEASGWSPDLLVLKGDLTQHGWRAEWAEITELVAGRPADLPVLAMPGNHDVALRRDIDHVDGLSLAGLPSDPVQHVDLPGVRVVAVDSTVEGRNHGTVAATGEAVSDLAADAARDGRAVLVFLHHPLEVTPLPVKYPTGVPHRAATRFAAALGRANPRSLISGGHTHRNRVHRRGPVVHTEVASTRDWPGVWAGYAVHEDGLRQVVRRIEDPAALGWIEYSRWAVGGVWRWYAPGRLEDRCFTVDWW